MGMTKLFIAALMFVTSVTFDSQVLVTKNGLDSNWDISVSTNSALALVSADAAAVAAY